MHGKSHQGDKIYMGGWYESRNIRGWRGQLENDIAAKRNLIWSAPVTVIYDPNLEFSGSENLHGCSRWFKLAYGPERQIAVMDLKKLKAVRDSIRRLELTDDQRLEKRKRDHARYAKLTTEQKQKRVERATARRAAFTEKQREHEREKLRDWRAKQGVDWHTKEAQMKRLRRLAKPELYKAIDKRSKKKTKELRAAGKAGQSPP